MTGAIKIHRSNRKLQRYGSSLVLFSGGIDSTTATYWARKHGLTIKCLYYDYEQGHPNSERESASKITQRLGIYLKVVEIPLLSQSLDFISPSYGKSVKLYGDVVTMLTIATTLAYSLGIDTLVLGINADDTRIYPAFKKGFFRAIERLSSLWMGSDLRILIPFLQKDKSSVVKMGIRLGVPFEETWSCSASLDEHCGICPDCVVRKNTLEQLCVVDLTPYKH